MSINYSCTFKIFIVLCVLYCIEFDTVVSDRLDVLKFWEPESRINARRDTEQKKVTKNEKQRLKMPRGIKKRTLSTPKSWDNDNRDLIKRNGIEKQLRTGLKDRYTSSNTQQSTPQKVRRYTKWTKQRKGSKSRREDSSSTQMPLTDTESDTSESDNDNVTHTLIEESVSPYTLTKQMENIFSTLPQANVTTEILGRTVAYNDIVLFKITKSSKNHTRYLRASKYADDVPEKKIIFIVHGLTTMSMQYFKCFTKTKYLKTLISYYLNYLDEFDIFLIPLANPDGFAQITLNDRMWYKNLSPQSACPGVFLDRNFDVAWQTPTVNSCSMLYPGSQPFSEAETRAVRDVFHRYSHKIIAYIHVHSGALYNNILKGDAVLYPKGFTDVQSDDDKYYDLKGEIDEAMANASFQVVSVAMEPLNSWYGKVSGTSVDYASTVYGIPYAMEFVMQYYSNKKHHIELYALSEIWERVINAIFTSIWRKTTGNDTD